MNDNSVSFIQYLRPNGRRRAMKFEGVSALCAQQAKDLQALGYEFTAEVLTTGDVSLTIEHPSEVDEDGPLAGATCNNGPVLENVIPALILQAWKREHERHRLRGESFPTGN